MTHYTSGGAPAAWRSPSLSTALAGSVLVIVAGCGGASDIVSAGAQPRPTGPSSSSPPASPTDPTDPTDPTEPPPSDSTSPTEEAPTEGPDGLPDGFGDGPEGAGLDRFYDQQVKWVDCEGGECADIWVPLDYDDPDGDVITLKAKREPAGDESRRLGSIFVNPGGPGGSGIEYLDYVAFDSTITDIYDVVGFDPRGVATSTPVDCVSDEELDAYVSSEPSPDTAQEVREFRADWAEFTAGCVANSGPLLEHVSTVEVARDLDILRALVGDKRLTFFGASYGTFIGATYAALFPDRVGRLVLDGAVDPLAAPRASAINQAAGFEEALTAYLQYCIDEGDCPLGDDLEGARERLIQLFAELDRDPLPTSGGRELTEGLAFYGVIVPLYSRDNWDYETQALREALEGNGDTLLLLADAYTDRQADGSYPDNSLEVQPAVNCLDRPEDESLQEIKARADEFLERSPVFGVTAQWWPYGCSNWPAEAAEPLPDFTAKGAAPILVVGTTRDPATPYEQAVRLADTLESGVLLSRDGDGHT
ncbi:MAG: alpha/beta fold hydrolase, partial [Nocardioidaceae bacterium]|nr:alpha/beta fold hydrolase [Nocardioidaceae bacterium]